MYRSKQSHRSDMITVAVNNFDSPRKMLAVSRPMSEVLRSRSQRAVGRRNDTQRISMASLALAQPHMTRSSQWNKPKPAGKSRMRNKKRKVISEPNVSSLNLF